MSLVTLRPSATVQNGGAITGGADADDVLKDNSGSSYVLAAPGGTTKVGLDNLTLPADTVVKAVRVRANMGWATAPVQVECRLGSLTTGPFLFEGLAVVSAVYTTNGVDYVFGSTVLTDAEIDGAGLQLINRGPVSNVHFVEAYVDVTLVTLPVVAVTAVSVVTTVPTIQWTPTLDPEGGEQTAFEVRIFNAAQYGAGGFNPLTSAALAYVEGEGSADSWQVPDALPVGDSYRAYVRLAQTVNGVLEWGAQDMEAWTIASTVLVPAPPIFALMAESAEGRMRVDVAASNLITNPGAETNTTGWGTAGSFRTNTGATLTRDTGQHNTGVASFKVVTTAVAQQGMDYITLPVVAGKLITVSAYAKGNAGGEQVFMVVGDSIVGSALSTVLTCTTGWQRMSVTFTPKATGTTGVAIVQSAASIKTFFVDDVQATETSAVATYVASPAPTERIELQRASSDYAENRVPTPRFDDGVGMWTGSANGPIGAVSVLVAVPSPADAGMVLAVTVPSSGSATGASIALPPAATGQTQTALVRVRTPVAQNMSVALEDNLLGNGLVIATVAVAANTWTDIPVTWTPTADSPNAMLYVYQSVNLAQTWWIARAIVAAGAATPTFGDGDTPAWEWDGLRGLSPSHRGEWVPVRSTISDDGLFGEYNASITLPGVTVRDYEAANGVTTRWRARAMNSSDGIVSAWAYTSGSWSSTVAWLKHPNRPNMNVPLVLTDYGAITRAARRGTFQGLGALHPTVIEDTRAGAAGASVGRVATVAELDRLRTLLSANATLLLQVPATYGEPDRYVRVGDEAARRLVNNATFHRRDVDLPWVEVDRPVGALETPDYAA